MHMKKLLLIFILLFLSTKIAFAEEGWSIVSFSTDLSVVRDGSVDIKENIDVDFQKLEKHGIFRVIPYVYTNQDGSQHYTDIKIISITRNGTNTTYSISKNSNNITIKIGNADKLISGEQRYVVSYTAKGVLVPYADHDELYWNSTGNEWGVPILSAVATVKLPTDGLQKVLCFEGYSGDKEQCNANITQNYIAHFSASHSLLASQGMTIVVGFKKGIVPILKVEKPKSFLELVFTPVNFLI